MEGSPVAELWPKKILAFHASLTLIFDLSIS